MMTRQLIRILSLLSLLIGLMLVAACVRGQRRADSFWWKSTSPNTYRALNVVCGKLGITLLWLRYDFELPGKAVPFARRYGRVWGLSHSRGTAPAGNPFAAQGSAFLGFGCRLGRVVREEAEDAGDFIPSDGPKSSRSHLAHVPYWALIPLFLGAGLPAVRAFIAARRRERRLAAGCCPSCGYDVRATPHRCPECGAVPDLRRGLAARLVGRHAPAVHACASLLIAASIGYVFASMRHDAFEIGTSVCLVVVSLGVLVKTTIGGAYQHDGRRAA